MEGIEISIGKVGARRDVVMLSVTGYVDTMTCSILLNKITESLNAGSLHIIIDMSRVNYVSSAGWGVFVGEIKGIRERGGDLKLVQMTPEVYDVFEMLEFNRILAHYDSIEEAINDFDISIGLDITKSAKRAFRDLKPQAAQGNGSVAAPPGKPRQRTGARGSGFHAQNTQKDPRQMPLQEKVRHVIIKDPTGGVFKIQKELRRNKYGRTKISPLRLYSLLRKINLETKEKRYRFYRSR